MELVKSDILIQIKEMGWQTGESPQLVFSSAIEVYAVTTPSYLLNSLNYAYTKEQKERRPEE